MRLNDYCTSARLEQSMPAAFDKPTFLSILCNAKHIVNSKRQYSESQRYGSGKFRAWCCFVAFGWSCWNALPASTVTPLLIQLWALQTSNHDHWLVMVTVHDTAALIIGIARSVGCHVFSALHTAWKMKIQAKLKKNQCNKQGLNVC